MWMSDIEDNHGNEYEQGVKNVQVHLMTQKVALIALYIFHNSKNRADQDQQTRRIKNVEMFTPGNLRGEGAWDRVFAQLQIKQDSNNNEEAKKDDLDKKARDDNALASLHTFKAPATLNAAT